MAEGGWGRRRLLRMLVLPELLLARWEVTWRRSAEIRRLLALRQGVAVLLLLLLCRKLLLPHLK